MPRGGCGPAGLRALLARCSRAARALLARSSRPPCLAVHTVWLVWLFTPCGLFGCSHAAALFGRDASEAEKQRALKSEADAIAAKAKAEADREVSPLTKGVPGCVEDCGDLVQLLPATCCCLLPAGWLTVEDRAVACQDMRQAMEAAQSDEVFESVVVQRLLLLCACRPMTLFDMRRPQLSKPRSGARRRGCSWLR